MIFWDIRVFVSEIFVLFFIGLNKREITSIIEKNTSSIISINFNFSLDNETLCIITSPRGLLKFNLQKQIFYLLLYLFNFIIDFFILFFVPYSVTQKKSQNFNVGLKILQGIICHRGNFRRRSLTRYVWIFLF